MHGEVGLLYMGNTFWLSGGWGKLSLRAAWTSGFEVAILDESMKSLYDTCLLVVSDRPSWGKHASKSLAYPPNNHYGFVP